MSQDQQQDLSEREADANALATYADRVAVLEGQVASLTQTLGMRSAALDRVTATKGTATARVRELEAEVERLVRWRKCLLDEGFGYDDSEESCAEVLEWAPIWRAQSAGDEHRADAAEAERDALQQRLTNGLTWAENARNHGVATGGLFAALAAPAVSSRPGMTVTEAVADALADHRENTGRITGGTPQEAWCEHYAPSGECEYCTPQKPQQADEADPTVECASCGWPRYKHEATTGTVRSVHGAFLDFCRGFATLQQDPVERITDANGDELEHGADTDAQTAQQQDRSDR